MVEIKKMPMPKTCADCRFMDLNHGDYPYCWATHNSRGYNFPVHEKRFPNCPLQETEAPPVDTELEERKDMCRVLFNRCYAIGSADGMMCVFCAMREKCDKERSVMNSEKQAQR